MSKTLSQIFFVEQVLPAQARSRGLTLAVQDEAKLEDMALSLVELDVYRQGGATQRGIRRATWVREGKGAVYATLGSFKVSASGGEFTRVEPIQPQAFETWRHAFQPGAFHGQWSAAFFQHRAGAAEVTGRRTVGDKQVALQGTVRAGKDGEPAGLDLSFEDAKGRKGQAWLELEDPYTLSGYWWLEGADAKATAANQQAARSHDGHLIYWKRDDEPGQVARAPLLEDPSAQAPPKVPEGIQAREGLSIPLAFRGISERFALFVPMDELRQEFLDALGKGLAKRTERAVFLEIGLRLNTLGGNEAKAQVSFDYFAEVEIPYDRGEQVELARKSIYARGYLEGSWLVFSRHRPHPATCSRKKALPAITTRTLQKEACVDATLWNAEYQRLARLVGVPAQEDWKAAEPFAEPYGKGVIQGWQDRDALWESIFFRYSLAGFPRDADENPFPKGRPEWFEYELYCRLGLRQTSGVGTAYERGRLARRLLLAGFQSSYVTKAEVAAQDKLEREQRKAWGDELLPSTVRVSLGSQGLAIRVPRDDFEAAAEAFQAAEDLRLRSEEKDGKYVPWNVEIRSLIQDPNRDVVLVKTYASQGYDRWTAPWDEYGPEWSQLYEFAQLLNNGRGDKGLLRNTYINDPAFTAGFEHGYKPDLADPVDEKTRESASFPAGVAQGKLLLKAKQEGHAAHAIFAHGRLVGRGEATRSDALIQAQTPLAGLTAKVAQRFYQAGHERGQQETAGARDAASFVRIGYLLGFRERDQRLVKTYASFGYGPATPNPYPGGRRKTEFVRFQRLLSQGTTLAKAPPAQFLAGFQDGYAGKPAPQPNPAKQGDGKARDPQQQGWEQGVRIARAFAQGQAAFAIQQHGRKVGKGTASKLPNLIRQRADEAAISAPEAEAHYETGRRQGKDEVARETLKTWLKQNQQAFRQAVFDSVSYYLEHPAEWKLEAFFEDDFPMGMSAVHTDAVDKHKVDPELFALQARHALRQAYHVMRARQAEGLALKIDEFILPKLEWLGAWFGFWQTEYFIECCRKQRVTLFSSGKVRRAGAFDYLDDPDVTLLESTGYAFLGLFDAAFTVALVWHGGAMLGRVGAAWKTGAMSTSALLATFFTGAARWEARNVLVALGGNLGLSTFLGVVGEGIASSIEERDFDTSLALSRILMNTAAFLLLGGALNLSAAKLIQKSAPLRPVGPLRLPLNQWTFGYIGKGWTQTQVSLKELSVSLVYAHMAVSGLRILQDVMHADDEKERKAAQAALVEMLLMLVLFEGTRGILHLSANRGVLQRKWHETKAGFRLRVRKLARTFKLELFRLPNEEVYQTLAQHQTKYTGPSPTLGVELEGQIPVPKQGTPRQVVAERIQASLKGQPGCEFTQVVQAKENWEVRFGPSDQNVRTIVVMGDPTIQALRGYAGVEIAFPPQTVGELALTTRVFRGLQQAGFRSARGAAIHIHVGLPQATAPEVMGIAKLFGDLEPQILDHFQVWSGRRAYNHNLVRVEEPSYLHHWRLTGKAPAGIPYQPKPRQLATTTAGTQLNTEQVLSDLGLRLGRGQARMLAFRSFRVTEGKQYTYEFRVFNSSVEGSVLRAYADFCRKLVQGIRTKQPDLLQYLQSTPRADLGRVMQILNIHQLPRPKLVDPPGTGH